MIATAWMPGRTVGDRLGWPEGLHVVDAIPGADRTPVPRLQHIPVDHLELLGLRVNRLAVAGATGKATLVVLAADHFLDRVPTAALAEALSGMAASRAAVQVELFTLTPDSPRLRDLASRLGLAGATPSIHKP